MQHPGMPTPIVIAGDFNLDALTQPTVLTLAKAGFRDVVSFPRTPTTPTRYLREDAGWTGLSSVDQYVPSLARCTIK